MRRGRNDPSGRAVPRAPAGRVDPLFAPAPASGSLTASVRAGVRMGALGGAIEQVLSTLTTLVLARVLAPHDFGLVALAVSVLSLVNLLSQFGFAPALVRREVLTQESASSTFWLVTGLGAVLSLLLLAVGPLAIRFLHAPEGGRLVLVLVPVPLLRLAGTVPRALLLRAMRYRALYTCEILAALVYAGAQIGLALAWHDAIAVVIGQTLSVTVLLVAMLVTARWRPSLAFVTTDLRADLKFGRGMFATLGVGYLAKNADYWSVGRVLGASTLGVYYIAYVLPNILRQRLTWVASSVLFPAFVRIAGDAERTRAAYLRSVTLHAAIGFPTMAGLAVTARPVIALFFGDRWAAAAVPMAIIALAALLEFTTQAATTVFLAHGLLGRNVIIEVTRLVTLLVGLGLSVPTHDLRWVAGAVLASSVAGSAMAQVLISRHLHAGVAPTTHALAPVVVPVAGMAALLLPAGAAVDGLPAVAQLLVLVPLGIAAVVALGLLLFRRRFVALLGEVGAVVPVHRLVRRSVR